MIVHEYVGKNIQDETTQQQAVPEENNPDFFGYFLQELNPVFLPGPL